jgi:hypothetical protein
MAALDFPAAPTVGQQYTAAGVTWTWDGAKWAASGLSVAYLPLAGGTMSGPIVLAADPAAAMQAATKQYVDAQVGALVPAMNDNRIINGDMRVNQRGAASGTANGNTVDRWGFQTNQAGKVSWLQNANGAGGQGFPWSLGASSSSAYASLAADTFQFYQAIEADMVSDFQWGTANAQPVTLSFWAQSSLTGTFSGSIRNYAATRSYPFTFAIPAANTWTKVIVTIPGDTGGTWVMSGNAGSLYVGFDLGCGANARGPANTWATTSVAGYIGVPGSVSLVATNGATFYVTGVKLEIGNVATLYNRQSLTKSMADCQRYFQTYGYIPWGGQSSLAGNNFYTGVQYNTLMRVAPTAALSNQAYNNASGAAANVIQTNCLTLFAPATAAGWATAAVALTLNAEL